MPSGPSPATREPPGAAGRSGRPTGRSITPANIPGGPNAIAPTSCPTATDATLTGAVTIRPSAPWDCLTHPEMNDRPATDGPCAGDCASPSLLEEHSQFGIRHPAPTGVQVP